MSINVNFNCRNNIIFNPDACQHLDQLDAVPNEAIQHDPEDTLRSWRNNKLRVHNLIIAFDLLYQRIFPSVDTIAKKLNLCEKTVREILKELVEDGVIKKIWRPFKSNLYILSSFFKTREMRSRLSHLFPALDQWLIRNYRLFKISYKELNINILQSGASVLEKVERIWSMKPVDPIPYAIQSQKILKLSLPGKIWMSAFPDKAITQALAAYKYQKERKVIEKPFHYLFNLAAHYTKEMECEPNWDKVRKLNYEEGFDGSENPLAEEQLSISSQPTQDKQSQVQVRDKTSRTELKATATPLSGFSSMASKSTPHNFIKGNEPNPYLRPTYPTTYTVVKREPKAITNQAAYDNAYSEFAKYMPKFDGAQ